MLNPNQKAMANKNSQKAQIQRYLALILAILGGTFANPQRGSRGGKRPTPTEAPNPEPPVPTDAPEPPVHEPTESPVDDDDSSNDVIVKTRLPLALNQCAPVCLSEATKLT